MKIKRDRWNTYAVYGYTYDVANDSRSQGGVHLHQVKCVRGHWFKRILQSNGRFEAAGPANGIAAQDGEAFFETAKEC